MWKKQDDVDAAQSPSPSKQQRDAAKLLGDVLSRSPSDDVAVQEKNLAVGSEETPKGSGQPLTSPAMNTYTEAVKEFTRNATGFIEQLPLLSKARAAYEEAVRASAEMRRVLDEGDENLRTLMTQLEQRIGIHEPKSLHDRKPPEPAKSENTKAADEGGGRVFKWP